MKKFLPLLLILLISVTYAREKYDIIVAADGSGDCKTLTEAIKKLPMFSYRRVTIFIKKGTYNERIRIERDYVTLIGEDKDETKIVYNLPREEWNKNPDNIGPGVINIYADDVVLKNLTIENTQPEIGPHAFAVYGYGTRTIIYNCNLISKGADTVSLWNYKDGMYYHAKCSFTGAVDFVCPRGWCFIRDSKFYEVKKTAALWHAGAYDKNQKFVIKNSFIDGVEGFQLARHHYEAQFIFIDCIFSENLSDAPIYRVTYDDTTRNRIFHWGKRYYFDGCKREGGNYDWMNDNLRQAGYYKEEITPAWTFDFKWDPESTEGPSIVKKEIEENCLILNFDEPVTVYGTPELTASNGTKFIYVSGNENSTVKFRTDKRLTKEDCAGLSITNDAEIISSRASVRKRNVRLD
jgi:pectinesterase